MNKKNYLVRSLVLLGSVVLLNACQHLNKSRDTGNNHWTSFPTAESSTVVQANSANKLNETTVENVSSSNVVANRKTVASSVQNNDFSAVYANLNDNNQNALLRKELLMSISKPGENVYRDMADRKERKRLNIKDPSHKMGIEEMAEYRRKITMPVGTDKMLYEEGYLMKEYQKAIQSPILKSAKDRNYAPTGKAPSAYSLNNVVFTERGPNNIPGRDRSIVPSPTNPDKWYVGSVGGGIWITDNGGTGWRNTTDYTVPSLATSTIAISASNPNIVYAGTGEPFNNLDALTGVGMVKSMDGGETWSYLSNTVGNGSIGRILANPANANHVVVGSSSGIYVTNDGGVSWTKKYPASGNSNVQDLKANNDFSVIYGAANGVGVVKSTDGGNTWTLAFDVAPYVASKGIKRIEVGVSPTDNSRIFLSCETSVGTATSVAFFMSDDAGATFNEITFASGDSKEIFGGAGGQGWYDNVIAVNPLDKNIFYAGGVYLAKFTVNPVAKTYTVLQVASGYTSGKLNAYVHPDQHGVVTQIHPTDPTKFRMLLTNDGGVYYTGYKTNPGETEKDWIGPVKNLNTTQFYGADKKKGEDSYLAGAQDNGSSATIAGTAPSTKDTSYLMLVGGDGFETLWNYRDPNLLLFGFQFNNFVTSRNGVQDSTLYYARNSDYGSTFSPFYSKLANANNNPDVVFTVSSKGVWRTPNFGASWTNTAFTPATNGTWLGNASFATVKVSVANPDVVWAASAVGPTTGTYAVNVSKDNGQTFTKTTGTLPIANNYYMSGLSASSIDAARAYVLISAAGQPKVMKTNDYGATWTDISKFSGGISTAGFPNVSVHSLIEMPFDQNVIWAGTDIGVFETINGGDSWYLITKMPPVSVWSMKIVDNQVVMATHGRGVWTATIPELSTYVLPEYVLGPTVKSFTQAGIHDMKGKAVFNYNNSKITALKVFVDNTYVATISNITPNTDISYTTPSALSEGTHTISVSGLYESGTLETIKNSINSEFISFNAGAQNVNIPSFTNTNDVYIGSGKFVVNRPSTGFATTFTALNNSGHPYAANTVYQTYLRTPIVVGADSKLTMQHIAITESGDADSNGAPYDPAVVEASKDLVNWVTLGVYDEKSYGAWTNNGASWATAAVNNTMFQNSILDIPAKFNAGDEVAVRLKLSTDGGVQKYGWVINFIVPSSSLAANDIKAPNDRIVLVPNPATDYTNLNLPASVKGNVTIGLYDASGKVIRTFTKQAATTIKIDVSDLQKGVYLVLVKGDNLNTALKLMK